MTTDELLAKLDAEHDNLEAGKEARYTEIGRQVVKHGVDFWQTKDAIEYYNSDVDRQIDIRKIQDTIRVEVARWS